MLVRDRIRLYRDSLVSPLLRAIKQLNMDITLIGHEIVLI
jgi:hypothetical protein